MNSTKENLTSSFIKQTGEFRTKLGLAAWLQFCMCFHLSDSDACILHHFRINSKQQSFCIQCTSNCVIQHSSTWHLTRSVIGLLIFTSMVMAASQKSKLKSVLMFAVDDLRTQLSVYPEGRRPCVLLVLAGGGEEPTVTNIAGHKQSTAYQHIEFDLSLFPFAGGAEMKTPNFERLEAHRRVRKST